jgi:hypothetical protein
LSGALFVQRQHEQTSLDLRAEKIYKQEQIYREQTGPMSGDEFKAYLRRIKNEELDEDSETFLLLAMQRRIKQAGIGPKTADDSIAELISESIER